VTAPSPSLAPAAEEAQFARPRAVPEDPYNPQACLGRLEEFKRRVARSGRTLNIHDRALFDMLADALKLSDIFFIFFVRHWFIAKSAFSTD